MGKVEDQQAMRQANRVSRHEASQRTASRRNPTTADPASSQALCGHRAISGRTCTREAGHQADGTSSHRYS